MEKRKGPGRPPKVEPTPQELEIKELKKALAEAETKAQDNYAYAKQVGTETETLRSELSTEKKRSKEIIDTLSYTIDTFENTIRMLRKAIERDLIKTYDEVK